jgi:hypothetical protein
MSNVKLQSLIRKFKNSSINEENTITNYSYNLSIDADLDTKFLFQTSKSDEFLYIIDAFEKPITYSKSIPINIVKKTKKTTKENNVKHYVDSNVKGYLHNLYNAELCNEDWAISMYFLSITNHLFIHNEKIKINSLHLNNLTHSTISAFHHVLYNSSIKSNIEWNWLNAIPYNFELNNMVKNTLEKVCKKYKQKLLHLIDSGNSTNNINYIINETSLKMSKVNMLCILDDGIPNSIQNSKSYIANIVLAIKLMDQVGILYVKIPNVEKWDTRFINILLLYSLIFMEVYVFEFDINTNSTFLLCKNKRKINNESIFKKLYHIMSNPNFTDHNLFDKKIFKETNIKHWLTKILNDTEVPSNTDEKKNNLDNTIVDYISSNLHINTETFL